MANDQKRIELTLDAAQKIGGALQRLKEIGSSTIIAPQHEAEQRGLIQFLNRELLTYADEFLACWIAVQTEYEPLIQGFAGLLSRSNGVLMRKMAQNQQNQPPQQPEQENQSQPDNVVTLTQP